METIYQFMFLDAVCLTVPCRVSLVTCECEDIHCSITDTDDGDKSPPNQHQLLKHFTCHAGHLYDDV